MNSLKTCSDIMPDQSEVILYDEPSIPMQIRRRILSTYPDYRAFCHWHEDLEFIRILKGQMNYHINGKTILLKEDDCVMVNTRQLHYGYSHHRQDCEFLCILLHPSLFASNKRIFQKYVGPVFENSAVEFLFFNSQTEEGGEMIALLDRIYKKKEHAAPGYELEIIGMIHFLWKSIYSYCAEHFPEKSAPASSDLSCQKDMVSYIYQHYADKITLDDIAASGNVCRSKCCSIFKHYLQQSPIDFLNAYRLKVSCYLLKNTTNSITQIALTCGFNHLSYYSKLFCRAYGCTPKEYRSM